MTTQSSAPELLPGTPPVRFMILSDARTGSNVLVEALNSHPRILCFREVMNFLYDGIDYAVEGYAGHDAADLELRANDTARFIRERIFSGHEARVHAAGFKFHYAHLFGAPGIIESLMADENLRIIHLRRRNALRSLVSRKLAEATGAWLDVGPDAKPFAPEATGNRLGSGGRTIGAVIGRLRGQRAPETPAPPTARIRLTREECLLSFHVLRTNIELFDALFEHHRKISVAYEDMVGGEETRAEIQRFLGVAPEQLRVRMRRQNPQTLPQLIENYDELRHAFEGTDFAAYFEE